MNESNLTRLVMLTISKFTGTTIFRNNTGMAWTGEAKRFSSRATVTIEPGDVVIKNARPLHAGLCKGSSDLIGWNTREVTPEMVGKKIAIFTAVEVKTERGRATPEQINFLTQVRQCGGIAGIARTPEDARNLIENQ